MFAINVNGLSSIAQSITPMSLSSFHETEITHRKKEEEEAKNNFKIAEFSRYFGDASDKKLCCVNKSRMNKIRINNHQNVKFGDTIFQK